MATTFQPFTAPRSETPQSNQPFLLGPVITGLDARPTPSALFESSIPPPTPSLHSSQEQERATTPPPFPKAPTFDSPGRFTQSGTSYPSPIQAGFRTPVSKASSRRSVSSAKVARALTFGDEDQAGFSPLSLDTRIAGFSSSPLPRKSSSRSLASTADRRDESGSSSQESGRPVLERAISSSSQARTTSSHRGLRSLVEGQEDRGSGSSDMVPTGLVALREESPLRKFPSTSTLGRGGRARPSEMDRPIVTPIIVPLNDVSKASSPVHTPVASNPKTLSGNYINMGDGLAGGPQRDSRGKKINTDKWSKDDPLSAGAAASGEKPLGGFKRRFSESLMNLVGQGKSSSSAEHDDQTPGARARRLFFGSRATSTPKVQEGSPPPVPERSSSHKNQTFLRNRAKTQSGAQKALPYSPSMPVLSESLANSSPTDARILAWLSTTSLNPEADKVTGKAERRKSSQATISYPSQTSINWSGAQAKPPLMGSQSARELHVPDRTVPTKGLDSRLSSRPTSSVFNTAPQSRASTPGPESALQKKRPRSLARLSSLFKRSSSKNNLQSPGLPLTPDTPRSGFQFPPVEDRRGSDTTISSMRKSIKAYVPGEALDSADSRWQKRRTSGDWRKMLQNTSGVLTPGEADHFASIIAAPSPTAGLVSRSSTPGMTKSPRSSSFEDLPLIDNTVSSDTMQRPLDKPLSRLSEVIEEDDAVHIRAQVQRVTRLYKSVGTQTEPAPSCSRCSGGGLRLSNSQKTQNHDRWRHGRSSITSMVAPSEMTETSAAVDEDAHIQTILSSPVHSVPAGSKRTSMIFAHADQVMPQQGQDLSSQPLDDSRLSLSFPMPPGHQEIAIGL